MGWEEKLGNWVGRKPGPQGIRVGGRDMQKTRGAPSGCAEFLVWLQGMRTTAVVQVPTITVGQEDRAFSTVSVRCYRGRDSGC